MPESFVEAVAILISQHPLDRVNARTVGLDMSHKAQNAFSVIQGPLPQKQAFVACAL